MTAGPERASEMPEAATPCTCDTDVGSATCPWHGIAAFKPTVSMGRIYGIWQGRQRRAGLRAQGRSAHGNRLKVSNPSDRRLVGPRSGATPIVCPSYVDVHDDRWGTMRIACEGAVGHEWHYATCDATEPISYRIWR